MRPASRLPPSCARGLIGALHDGKNGALAQPCTTAGENGSHLDRGAHLRLGDDQLGLDVLFAHAPDRFELVQAAALGRAVLGGDRHPMEGDTLQRIGNAGDIGYILLGCAPAGAGEGVQDLNAAAVGAQEAVVAVQGEIQCGIQRSQGVGRRHQRQVLLHDSAGDFGDHRAAIDRRAVRFQDVERFVRREPHAGAFDDIQGCRVYLADFGIRQDIHAELGIGDGFNGLSHRGFAPGISLLHSAYGQVAPRPGHLRHSHRRRSPLPSCASPERRPPSP